MWCALAMIQQHLPPRHAVALMHNPTIERFEGRLYGVCVEIELNTQSSIATVFISDVPLGGRLCGTGWLKETGRDAGAVVLEAEFEKRLRRRFVTIRSAVLDRIHHTISVQAVLPALGAVELTLRRT